MKNVTVSKRVKAYFIDLSFMVTVIFGFLGLIRGIVLEIWKITENESALKIINICFLICAILCILIFPIFKYLIFPCGDIGFKIVKIRVVDSKSELPPTKKQLMLRGLFFIIFPIDIIFACKRADNLSLSDKATNTKVIRAFYYDSEN